MLTSCSPPETRGVFREKPGLYGVRRAQSASESPSAALHSHAFERAWAVTLLTIMMSSITGHPLPAALFARVFNDWSHGYCGIKIQDSPADPAPMHSMGSKTFCAFARTHYNSYRSYRKTQNCHRTGDLHEIIYCSLCL